MSPDPFVSLNPAVHWAHVTGSPSVKPMNRQAPLYVLSVKWLFWWLLMCVGTAQPVNGAYVPYSEKSPL